MTRVIKIQNMEQEGSHRTLIIALHQIDGAPVEQKLDPQREMTLAIHDGAPMISIGKAPIAESDLPSETVIATARSAAGLQEQLDAALAENQQGRADREQLASELERLTKAAAEHKPEGTDLTAKELEELRSNHTTLAQAYDKRFEELKASEARNAELSDQLAKLAEAGKSVGGGVQSEGTQPGSEHSKTPAPTIVGMPDLGDGTTEESKPLGAMNKGELVEEAGRRGVEIEDGAKKADVRAALDEDEDKRLGKMTKAELQDEAKAKKVELDGNETKAEIIEKLKA